MSPQHNRVEISQLNLPFTCQHGPTFISEISNIQQEHKLALSLQKIVSERNELHMLLRRNASKWRCWGLFIGFSGSVRAHGPVHIGAPSHILFYLDPTKFYQYFSRGKETQKPETETAEPPQTSRASTPITFSQFFQIFLSVVTQFNYGI